jgi:hypothetical protein
MFETPVAVKTRHAMRIGLDVEHHPKALGIVSTANFLSPKMFLFFSPLLSAPIAFWSPSRCSQTGQTA